MSLLMSVPCKSERSLLSGLTHHPAIYDVDGG
jgi:hypothetical protein